MQVNKTLENPCQSAMDEYTNKWITKKKINKRWNFIQYVFLYCNIQTRTISNKRHIHTKWNPFLNTDIIKRLVRNKQQKTTSMMLTFFLPFTHMQSFVELCLGFRSFRFHASLFRRCMAIGIGSKAPDESNIFLICFMIFRRLYLISREKKNNTQFSFVICDKTKRNTPSSGRRSRSAFAIANAEESNKTTTTIHAKL